MVASPPKRNVETIRQKNLKDNQIFLEKILMTDIRKDFINSARSILTKERASGIKKKLVSEQERVERVTRYREKVNAGEISPHVPEWQRVLEEKKKAAEQRLLEKQEQLFIQELRKIERELKREAREKMRLEQQRRARSRLMHVRWAEFYKNSINGNPYQRVFQPRHSKVDERIRQSSHI